jgi:hypothetical protein
VHEEDEGAISCFVMICLFVLIVLCYSSGAPLVNSYSRRPYILLEAYFYTILHNQPEALESGQERGEKSQANVGRK